MVKRITSNFSYGHDKIPGSIPGGSKFYHKIQSTWAFFFEVWEEALFRVCLSFYLPKLSLKGFAVQFST